MKAAIRRQAIQAAKAILPGPALRYAKSFVKHPVAEIEVSVSLVLLRFREVDFIRQYELDALEKAFRAAPDPALAADEILQFFNLAPEKCKLLCDSNYFRHANPSYVSLRLATLIADYINGEFDRLGPVSEELVTLWPHPVSHVLKARAVSFTQGLESEKKLLEAALQRFPQDRLITLNLINCLITLNDVGAVDALIDANRSMIAGELTQDIAHAQKNQKILEDAISRNLMEPEGVNDIYTDEFCRNMWMGYYESFSSRNGRQHGDSALREEFLSLLETIADKTDILLDFGCMCAEPLAHAATKYPQIQFFGCDRQDFLADLNNNAWPLSNLKFYHGDILDTLKKISEMPGRKTLLHIRTTCVIYPAFVKKFYQACAEAGIDHILILEGGGVSRVDLRLHDFNAMDCISIISNHRIFAHDYKTLLKDAGYGIKQWRRMPVMTLWNRHDINNYLGTTYSVIAERHG